MIGAEVAISLLLLVGSLLLLRSLAAVQAVDPGLAADRLLTAGLTTPPGRYDEPPAALALYESLVERARALPGAQSAAAINILPMSGSFDGRGFTIEGRPAPAPGDAPSAEARVVTPGFFGTAGVPVLEGRGLTRSDGPDAVPVLVVNRAAAERYWPGERAVGQRIDLGDRVFELVGVVGDVRQFALDRPAEPAFYLAQAQAPVWLWLDSALLVRTGGVPADLAGGLRDAVRRLDQRIAVEDVLPMARVIGGTLGPARFRTVLLAVFACLALVLGAIGLYGVVAYATAGRSRELGIRMALGAQRHRVVALVMREGLVPAVAGAAVGLGAAFVLARLLDGLLFEVDPLDPVVYGAAALLLLLAAACACFLPARRATRADPIEALRT